MVASVIVCTMVMELTDEVRLERAVTLAELAIGRYGLRDARLRPLGDGGFKQVFLAESPTRGRLERAPEALIEGYADVRGLPPDHERLFRAFDVMQRTAAVNRTLQLRPSETTRGRAHRDAFLRQFVVCWRGVTLRRPADFGKLRPTLSRRVGSHPRRPNVLPEPQNRPEAGGRSGPTRLLLRWSGL